MHCLPPLDKEHALEFLKIVRDCCQGLDWCITCGALLGAVRGGDFIDWDFDIDVLLHRKHIREFPRIAACLIKHGCNATIITLPDDRPSVTDMRTFIQIYYKGVPGHIMLRTPKSFRGSGYFNFGNVVLHGVEFPCPGNVEKFLTEMYGSDWRSPKPAKVWERVATHTAHPGHPVPKGAWHD